MNGAAEIGLEEFDAGLDVHLGKLVGVESGEFAPGGVQRVELLLLMHLRGDVAHERDQPGHAPVGRGDRAHVGLQKRLHPAPATVHAEQDGHPGAGGGERISGVGHGERLAVGVFNRHAVAAQCREQRLADRVALGRGAEHRVGPEDDPGRVENGQSLLDVADDEFVAAEPVEHPGDDVRGDHHRGEATVVEPPGDLGRVVGHWLDVGRRGQRAVEWPDRRAD